MSDELFDVLPTPLEITEDTDIVGEFVAAGRGRYPLAVAPVRVPKGTYTVRLEVGLLDREAVVLEVDPGRQTITVLRAYPDMPRDTG